MSMLRQPPHAARGGWTTAQCVMAARIWQRDMVDVFGDDDGSGVWAAARKRAIAGIALCLGKHFNSVAARLEFYGPSFWSRRPSGSLRASEYELAERDARRKAADRRDLTAVICGDPPPGYSALDRRDR